MHFFAQLFVRHAFLRHHDSLPPCFDIDTPFISPLYDFHKALDHRPGAARESARFGTPFGVCEFWAHHFTELDVGQKWLTDGISAQRRRETWK